TVICRKSGLKPSIWCWVPLVQWILLLRAARMSAWCILLWLLPLGNLLAWIIWSVKICRVRGKGGFTIFCLLFPLTAPLAFLYLAMAKEQSDDSPAAPNKVHLSYEEAVG